MPLGCQALVVAWWVPFRRPGRFVLGLRDVLVAWWRCGFLRRLQPRLSLTPNAVCRRHPATTGEQLSHFCHVDIL